MRKTIFLLAFSLISNIAQSQEHGMVIRKDSTFSNMWILEERSNHRSMAPFVCEDGSTPEGPYDIYRADMVYPESEDHTIVSIMTNSLLSHYSAKGIDEFSLNYIITPDGKVAEVFFVFSRETCPEITDTEMVYWRSLSDEIKRTFKFTIPERARGLKFYNMGRTIEIFKLLHPELAKPIPRSSSKPARVPIKQMTPEELELKRIRDEKLKKEMGKDSLFWQIIKNQPPA